MAAMSIDAAAVQASSARMRVTLSRCRLACLLLVTVSATVANPYGTVAPSMLAGFALAWLVGGLGAVDARRPRTLADPVVVATALADSALIGGWIAAFPDTAPAVGLTTLGAAANAVLLKGVRLGLVGGFRCAVVSSAFWGTRALGATTLRQYATILVADIVVSMLVARLASEERRRGRAQAALLRETESLAAALRRDRAIYRATRAVAAASGLEEALESICAAAGELVGADFTTVLLATSRGQRVRAGWNVPPLDETVRSDLGPALVDRLPSGVALARGEVVWIADVRNHPDEAVRDLAHRVGWRSCLAVPMISREQTIGSLNLYFVAPEVIDGGRMALAGLLAAEAAGLVRTAVLIEELREQAVTDPLTRLFNFRFARERLEALLAEAQRRSRPLSVLFIDVDNLKDVNDCFGHAAGDRLLQGVAQSLREQLRPNDLAARAGGDEFLVVLPETDAAGAAVVAQRICEALSRAGQPGLRPTVSIGQATAPGGGTTVDALVQTADLAMYTAKRTGRNRCVGADPRTEGGERSAPSAQSPAGGSCHPGSGVEQRSSRPWRQPPARQTGLLPPRTRG